MLEFMMRAYFHGFNRFLTPLRIQTEEAAFKGSVIKKRRVQYCDLIQKCEAARSDAEVKHAAQQFVRSAWL
jgi:hypothetical protein